MYTIRINQFVNSVFNSNSYVIDNGNIAVIVDVGDVKPLVRYLNKENIEPVAILITHTHYDHIYGIREFLKENPSIPIYTSQFGKEAFKNPKWNFSRYHNDEIIIDSDNIKVAADNEIIELFPETGIQVISTPGHDKSCFCYKIGDCIFTGDSYIPGIKVVATFPNSNKLQAETYHCTLMEMSNYCCIFPGHGDIQTSRQP